MHFKHPEILWALFLLLIPVIVHLFQLRKFQKTPFTNVKFLKGIQVKTRKSSRVKKWLVLASRMLLLACLVLAFAQPYTHEDAYAGKARETVIYLDNSFSMQARGARGELLAQAVRDIISQETGDGPVSLFTNDASFVQVSIPDIKQELLKLDYTPGIHSPHSVLLKGRNLFSNDSTTLKNFVLISDFRGWSQGEVEGWTEDLIPENDSLIRYDLVQLLPQNTGNTAVDSIYISERIPTAIQLTVLLSKSDSTSLTLPVSLYNENTLIAKTTAGFDNSDKAEAVFRIPRGDSINGRVVIEDNGLWYDNTIYFNLNPGEKTNVMTINATEADFLERIFTPDEFHLVSTVHSQLDYSLIPQQDIIILNGLNTIPPPLTDALKAFYNNGKYILIIPSSNVDEDSYNQIFKSLNIGSINKIYSGVFSYNNATSAPVSEIRREERESPSPYRKKVTDIRFSHPVFEGVFDPGKKALTNFQYPEATMSFRLNSPANTILAFEDNTPFLAERNNVYFFTSALDPAASDFRNSPLIVPTLYNIGKLALKAPGLYYQVGRNNIIDIKKQNGFSRDAIVSLEKGNERFIPLQRTFPDKVQITTFESPAKEGTYQVKYMDSTLQNLSFNYSRKESDMHYPAISSVSKVPVYNSVENALREIKNTGGIRELWKWFVIFAIVFLVLEILLLKYFK